MPPPRKVNEPAVVYVSHGPNPQRISSNPSSSVGNQHQQVFVRSSNHHHHLNNNRNHHDDHFSARQDVRYVNHEDDEDDQEVMEREAEVDVPASVNNRSIGNGERFESGSGGGGSLGMRRGKEVSPLMIGGVVKDD
jgi:hypothetical protein